MSTQIFYGSGLAYPSGQPTPLPSFNEDVVRFGERWNVRESCQLHGQLTGCTYDVIQFVKTQLENIYSSDFQPLTILQDQQVLYYAPYNRIINIDFQQSRMIGVLDYTIELQNYPAILWSGFYGVIDPVNEWSFTERDDKLLEITHKISAKGINTSSGASNAFLNAKNYVLGITGINSFIPTYLINYCTGIWPCIDTFSESINRFNNTYEIQEKYVAADLYNGGAGYIRYSTTYNCDINRGTASLDINGEVKSCRNAPLSILRQKYLTFDVYSAAVQSYDDACGRIDLNPTYLTSGVNEDNYNKKINFNIQFDNDWTPRTWFDYQTDIKIDDNDITTVDVKGVIKGRGDLASRWQNVQFYYNNELNLFYLANQAYNDFESNLALQIPGLVTFPLNFVQQSYSVSKNPFLGEIAVSTSYNNEDILSLDFRDLQYDINFKPAIEQIISEPLVNLGTNTSACSSYYYTADLGFLNRGSIEVKGRAIGACTGTYYTVYAGVKNLANYIITTYGNPSRIFLDKNSVTQSNEFAGNDINFDFAWSFDALQPADISPFNQINTLWLGSIPTFPSGVTSGNNFLLMGGGNFLLVGGGNFQLV